MKNIIVASLIFYLLVFCAWIGDKYCAENKWQIPNVGDEYTHHKNEIVMERNTLYEKYKIVLEDVHFGEKTYFNKAAFVTVKKGVVVAIWIRDWAD